ncbi:hypothetical protein J31TS4_16400 [Paenibacillus sp. J31TS4]|uniref:N-acetylglucosamine-6-phosphate deacetylase n=1 Tax=Paenibacillus sp. J31TS4 TaxID=2807195 RepID=UPI001B1F15E1|nr:amidohydrolase family protein [Paenibacillus sp. J31TS4]GIP38360.1 hypothetical protein J31TS4_16400 [Paenibacillus sp. J31TS4]
MSGETQVWEARHYQTGLPVRVTAGPDGIRSIEPLGKSPLYDAVETREHPSELPWIAPGLVDLQINGYAGIDFNTPPVDPEAVRRVTRLLWAQGVTSYYPTVITNSEDAIAQSVRAIAEACEGDPLTAASVAGIHVEGPFISPVDGARGAHDKRYVQAPDWEMFQRLQEAAGGRIRILTLSPEWDGAPAFIEKCAASGVTVSIGHTVAEPEQIRAAVAAGARMSTHLGNGSLLMLPRHPNYIWEQLAQDELWPCMIADGFHLPESVMKVFLKAKPDQLMIVSDAVYLSGMEPGTYDTHIGGRVVLTPEGRLHTAENVKVLAGSAQMLPFNIENLVRLGLCSAEQAWEMASIRPAGFMGLPQAEGLAAGAPADVVLFRWQDDRLQLEQVYKQGVKVHG